MQVPYVMSPGFPARSGEVNANFDALAAAITALQAKVASLETATATVPIAGSYTLIGMQNGLIPAGPGAIIEGITYRGTLTLGADHSATLTSLIERKNTLRINVTGPSGRQYTETTESNSGTWDQNDPTVSFTLWLDGEQFLKFGRGSPRLFVGTHINPQDGSDVVLFLVRNPDPVPAT